MLKLVCLVGLVACVSAQLFGHHETHEQSTFMFHYDPISHYMVGRTHSNCYFMSLGDDDKSRVHTPLGLEAVEMKMIKLIDGGEDSLSPEDMLKHSILIDIMCRHHNLFNVDNPAQQTTVTYPHGRTTTPKPFMVPTTTTPFEE
ncbi:uncharacterized protein [Argopecten irradians]|uniref:uncharacterized protein n=1 Tax=Argopecten irradians TaxID=31199 RepID=UPI00371004B6